MERVLLAVVLLSCAVLLVQGTDCVTNVKHGETFRKSLNKFLGQVVTAKAVHESGEKYTYKIGICAEPEKDLKPGCAVVQEKNDDGGGVTVRCVGALNSSTVVESPGGWLELTYSDGDKYHSHCAGFGRVTRILFDCSYTAGKGTPMFVEENNEDKQCYYLFYWQTTEMCDNTLSPGSIILIIFAVLLSLCLLGMFGGFLYLRFVVGAKGTEQIPLYEYFREFGNLQADGCDLVCRSSGSIPASLHKRPIVNDRSTAPSNVKIDSETDEDEQDENLLPM